ncbi:hypothetical protein HanOQP8_Chr15g0568251 [Helianthus annuus]|uniref:Uncharacterized protein n=1 Tax=Helianthus annuus TaxID=4232 RepID=A0A251VG22_HELAN|nr:hypothetical protein HanHA89_Chr15g0609441 [Helianthus annuus]KAJ0648254.1 hypothetical protein HanLR1_Chr15g0570811 [Helianthus annuus]KAJ0652096.1 hypothetical protein HanOQP8_Chr15g0568251 [Helianthus annuus]
MNFCGICLDARPKNQNRIIFLTPKLKNKKVYLFLGCRSIRSQGKKKLGRFCFALRRQKPRTG